MMFVPDSYRPPDQAWMADVIREHALALLITVGPDGPLATHVPTILDGDPPADGLAGVRVLGHMNRANPHWRALEGPALLVYQGPQGYVSPTIYDTTPAAPTWNFTAVHLRGRLEPIDDRAATLDVVRRTAATLERELGDGWDQSDSLGYFDQLLPGVGAFAITVDTAEGMFKLSQEQQPAVRDRVACSFAGSDRGSHRQLADLMWRAMPAETQGRSR